MTIGFAVALAVRILLCLLFLPFSALDKILNFSGAVAQARQIVPARAAVVMILAGLAVEIIMPLCILTGVADRLAAFVMAGYCGVTALLWKQFWATGDFWAGSDSKGRRAVLGLPEEFCARRGVPPGHVRDVEPDGAGVPGGPARLLASLHPDEPMTLGGPYVTQLLRVGLNVAGLAAAASFYTGALGFVAGPVQSADPAIARLLGANAMQTQRLVRGGQEIELAAMDPPGAPYPPVRHSNDPWFQHCAIATGAMAAAYDRLQASGADAITEGRPQHLPPNTGGVTAFKFRDPEGHPLELIHFPDRPAAAGIDHSAIVVTDMARSLAFYKSLGLRLASQGVNTGPQQDALDGLPDVRVGVAALLPEHPVPHVELLAYHAPPGRPPATLQPRDIAASRLVFAATGLAALPGAVHLADGSQAVLLHDPDGHALLLLEPHQRLDRA